MSDGMSDTLISNGTAHVLQPRAESSRKAVVAGAATSSARSAEPRRGAQPYDALLWLLQSRQAEGVDSVALGLIGCEDRTGVTTIATNLAVRASELGLGPVLLIEADAERPRVARAWRLANAFGLGDALVGRATLADCSRLGPAAGLQVLTVSGPTAGDVDWDAAGVEALLAEARTDYRLVLVDLPAASRLNGALLLARRLDEVLLVVRAERSRRPAIERAADRLIEDGVPLTGAVLNRRRTYLPRWLTGLR
jgi:Mrp family chromosome partitioning ATPase